MRTIVNIDVPDLQRAIAFYTAALDLRLTRIIDGDVAELTGASSMVYLLANPAGASALAGNPRDSHRDCHRNYHRHWTPVHIDFVVDDVERAAQRALAAGALREGECVVWRGSKCITFADPFGHGFCLIEFEAGTYSE
jgi:catechol 2,3-dioxygenase-like lactoylglutathione lyase family enzyme